MPVLAGAAVTLSACAGAGAFVGWWGYKSRSPFEGDMVLGATVAVAGVVPVVLRVASTVGRTSARVQVTGLVLATLAIALSARLWIAAWTTPLHVAVPFGWVTVTPVLLAAAAFAARGVRVRGGGAAAGDRAALAIGSGCLVLSLLAGAHDHPDEGHRCLVKCGGDPRDGEAAVAAYVERERAWGILAASRAAPRGLAAAGAFAAVALLAAGSVRIHRRRRFLRRVARGAVPGVRLADRDGARGVAYGVAVNLARPYRDASPSEEWLPV